VPGVHRAGHRHPAGLSLDRANKIALLESLGRRTTSSWSEFGLQSIHDRTLEFINRGHDYAASRTP